MILVIKHHPTNQWQCGHHAHPRTHLYEDGDFGQVVLPGFLGEALEAGGGAVGPVDGGEEGDGYPTAHDGQPHGGAHHRGVAARADGARTEGVHDGQEAVHADAGEEEHAAVDVGDEGRAGDLTQPVPERPVAVDVVEDLEGQCDHEHQVGERQVGHEHGGLVAHLHAEAEDEEGGAVGHQAQDENHAVDHRVQVVLEGIVDTAVLHARLVDHQASHDARFTGRERRREEE